MSAASARILLVAASLVSATQSAAAQLRPLEPIPWRMFEASNIAAGEVGGSRLFNQRASLAGTSGTLTEAANFSLAWRTGRVVLEGAGTGERFFREDSRFAEPYRDVDPATDGHRHDSGDYRISTAVRLTPDNFPVTGVVRFGTRLPTTDNTTGLDRDATDFFATVAAASTRRSLSLSAEGGIGISGTREPRFEQEDLLLYAVHGEYRHGLWTPTATLLGQVHGTAHSQIRGVENLGEARVGIRIGVRQWVRVEAIRGYCNFSPSAGMILAAGFIW